MMRLKLFHLLLTVLGGHRALAVRRDLSEITYLFSTCGVVSYDGPRVNNQCLPFYTQMNSPLVANPETLFQFGNFDGFYDGAQGFRLPRDGLYNITVAGASGGEGVCNYHYGLGGVISAQVRLTTDHEYLILVGQKGTSVCDVPENADHPICQRPRPRNFTEAQACQSEWMELTSDGIFRYFHNGGGGGGGASMIWSRNVVTGEFTKFPIVISPGGGGASAVLTYDVLASFLPLYGYNYPRNESNETQYTVHANGHLERYYLRSQEGARGLRLSDGGQVTSGAGSGWIPFLNLPLRDIDGKLLSQRNTFAQGGFDCSINLIQINSNVFTNVFGGFGGGGGGCGSGGGGGGYSGGDVIGNGNTIPGGGGDAAVFALTEHQFLGLPLPEQLRWNNGDGYVEIVPSDCGCDGECVVYNEMREFECLCPNGTFLAEDGSSCYHEQAMAVLEVNQLLLFDPREPYFINGFRFIDAESFLIFGLNVSLTVSPKNNTGLSPEDVACAVVLVGEDNAQIVLASNSVRSGTGQASQLTLLGPVDGDLAAAQPISDYLSLLVSPILVTGVFLLSNGECSIASPFLVNTSFVESRVWCANQTDSLTLGDSTSAVLTSAILLLQDPRSETEPTTNGSVSVGSAVAGIVAGAILITILIAVCLVLVCVRKRLSEWSPISKDLGSVRSDATGLNLVVNASYFPFSLVHTGSFRGTADEELSSSSQWGLSEEDKKKYVKVFASSLIPLDSITFGEEIGQGAFGRVYKGQMQIRHTFLQKDVAIKTINRDVMSLREMKAFLEEILLMRDFKHPNILGLAGVCFDTPDGVPFIILPFMANGSLKDYLKKKRTHLTNVDTLPQDLSVAILVRMCMDIACGMEYLAEEKFVHRDLAARNCMVNDMLQVKVGDFGLARDIYTNEYYRARREARLPVKWMAPEGLLDGMSSERTDIWSFGVTCWEVFSLGRVPYPGKQNQEILSYITEQSQRLDKPSLCPAKMFDLMMSQCWQLLPEERPTFKQMAHQLQEYWEEEHAYSYVRPLNTYIIH